MSNVNERIAERQREEEKRADRLQRVEAMHLERDEAVRFARGE